MRELAFALALAAALALGPAASGQVSLPGLPDLAGGVLQDLPETANQVLDTRALRDVRRLQIRDLLRTHRDVLEADPDGQPIVRRQILAMAPDTAALERARAAGFEIVRSDQLEGLGALVTLRAPERLSTRRALRRLREANPEGVYDYDHVHMASGPPTAPLSAPPLALAGPGGGGLRIGLIDGGVGAHPALTGVVAEQRGFISDTPVPSAHALAIASLLAGRDGPRRSAALGARILVADIYGGAPTGGSSSALARALSWLAGENTPVINVSLVGPRNRIVETVTARLVARGFLIVAAVGNDGPAAAPLYPASYPGVIGVTGVDARGRVLIEAGRGPQVDFAAPGVIEAASGRDYARVRGTSYAAPLVAGLLAQQLPVPDPETARRAINRLRALARDLGDRGRDNVYGDGLVGAELTAAQAQ